jgi:Ca-activated chloride channel family protein
MQKLAQNGNGNAAYIDNLNEARKVLVDEAGSTLFTIAKDVKFQIEFNPNLVAEYRLIGYETRILNREDFNNDKVDAGDIGSGHSVTAIYEITPVNSNRKLIDDLRYNNNISEKIDNESFNNEYAFLKIRYKLPDSEKSELTTTTINKENEYMRIDLVPADIRFAASVAAFGQLLRGGTHTGKFTYKDLIDLAKNVTGKDTFGYRHEFLNLVRLAESIR